MKKRAFTLIELLIVLVIIGIVVTLAVPCYESYVLRMQSIEAKQVVRSLAESALRYYQESGRFPDRYEEKGFEILDTKPPGQYSDSNGMYLTKLFGYRILYDQATLSDYGRVEIVGGRLDSTKPLPKGMCGIYTIVVSNWSNERTPASVDLGSGWFMIFRRYPGYGGVESIPISNWND